MAETTSITIRLPNDVLAAIDHQGGKRTDALIAALRTWMGGGQSAPDQRVAELEAENRDLQRKLMDALKALVDAKHPADAKRARGADPMGRSAHPAGPVLATTAPEVAGQTGWCGLKGIDKAKR